MKTLTLNKKVKLEKEPDRYKIKYKALIKVYEDLCLSVARRRVERGFLYGMIYDETGITTSKTKELMKEYLDNLDVK